MEDREHDSFLVRAGASRSWFTSGMIGSCLPPVWLAKSGCRELGSGDATSAHVPGELGRGALRIVQALLHIMLDQKFNVRHLNFKSWVFKLQI
jgi:hypothetical protein